MEPAPGKSCSDFAGVLARLAVLGVLAAVGAELLERQPIRVVAPVLLGDVVAVLTHLASQGDLGTNIGNSHGSCLSSRTES